jgi:hypothetical protein
MVSGGGHDDDVRAEQLDRPGEHNGGWPSAVNNPDRCDVDAGTDGCAILPAIPPSRRPCR